MTATKRKPRDVWSNPKKGDRVQVSGPTFNGYIWTVTKATDVLVNLECGFFTTTYTRKMFLSLRGHGNRIIKRAK